MWKICTCYYLLNPISVISLRHIWQCYVKPWLNKILKKFANFCEVYTIVIHNNKIMEPVFTFYWIFFTSSWKQNSWSIMKIIFKCMLTEGLRRADWSLKRVFTRVRFFESSFHIPLNCNTLKELIFAEIKLCELSELRSILQNVKIIVQLPIREICDI